MNLQNIPIYSILTHKQRLILVMIAGIGLGVGLFTLYYANAFSYLGSNPKTCANCHIMHPQYDSWQRSSHHAAAGCVDCHLPHDLVGKYVAKSLNGYHHSKAFTLQNFHEPIRIKAGNSKILQDNCVRCHRDMVSGLITCRFGKGDIPRCVQCHWTSGHGETAGLGGPEDNEINERNKP